MSIDAWLFFNSTPERNRRILYSLLKAFGTPDRILGLTVNELTRIQGVTPHFAGLLLKQPEVFDIQAEKDSIARNKAILLPITHPDYPKNLRTISDPPILLYLKGALISEDEFGIAVVGSRLNSFYGKTACRTIVEKLAKSGITITSGMARGIDTLAHTYALGFGGRTIAVLGNGLDICYPDENAELMEQIAQKGAVLSEYPMNTPPQAKNFPERNAVIAGLSLGVVVIEAAEKSGSLITARAGLEENRAVYAVPGDIFEPSAQGTNALIREGAQLVRSGEDILEDLSLMLQGMIQTSSSDSIRARATNPVSDKEKTP